MVQPTQHKAPLLSTPIAYTNTTASFPQTTNYIFGSQSQPLHKWFLDSGATTHVTIDLGSLQAAHPYTGTEQVNVGNGQSLQIKHVGYFTIINPAQTRQFLLNNVLHVPRILKNLYFKVYRR